MSDLGPLMSLRMNWTFPKWMTQTTAGGEKEKCQFGFYLFRSGTTDCSPFLTSLGTALNCRPVKSHMLQVISTSFVFLDIV